MSRNVQSVDGVQYFDSILDHLIFQIGYTNTNEIKMHDPVTEELVPLSNDMINILLGQLNPKITTLTIYYPISRNDEFDLMPIVYNIPAGIRPIDILGAIGTFYGQPVTENNILAYIEKSKNTLYNSLLEKLRRGQGVTLKDLMFERQYVEGLRPFLNGYKLIVGT